MNRLRIAMFAVLGVAVAVGMFAAVTLLTGHHSRTQPPSQHHPSSNRPSDSTASKRKTCAPPDTKKHYLGVVIYRPWRKTLPVFEKQGGVKPKIIEYYVEFGSPFDMAGLKKADRSAFPLIQLDPKHASVQGIADGQDDSYLTKMAKAVASFKCPVGISFGHEMNGNWYPWGASHVTPALFIAAWRHIFDVFAKAGAHNVSWTWTINRVSAYVTGIKQWWPGQKYVDWVGIDGYARTPGQHFGYIFGPTIQQLHSITHDPILITETAITREGPQGPNIQDLFQGARKAGVFGVVWFDVHAKENWTLAGRPSSVLAEFKAAVRAYER